MAAAGARQRGPAAAGQAAGEDLVGRRAERRVDLDPAHILEPGNVVEPAAADDAEHGILVSHGERPGGSQENAPP